MKVVNYTKARNNLRSLIEEAVDNEEEIIITTKDEKSVVMVSLDQYNLSYAAIKRDVKEALMELKEGKVLTDQETFEPILKRYED